jgi:glycogen operon protein
MSVGVPMISGGDELGRTQHGNNNAYAQDNEISWTHWELSPENQDFLEFATRVIAIWKQNPVLRRRKFLQGRPIRGVDTTDLMWLHPSGSEMTDAAWNAQDMRCIGMRLNGDAIDDADDHGERVIGDTLVVMLNGCDTIVTFMLPRTDDSERWEILIDTWDPWRPAKRLPGGGAYELQPRSVAVLKLSARAEPARRSVDTTQQP